MMELPELPEPFAYPTGDVGFCACGGMPGGKCLKCPPLKFYMNEQVHAYGQRCIDLERERCALLCELIASDPQRSPMQEATAKACAEAIRRQ